MMSYEAYDVRQAKPGLEPEARQARHGAGERARPDRHLSCMEPLWSCELSAVMTIAAVDH